MVACRSLRAWLHEHGILDLPADLGLLYFINSCVQSLPLTANLGFLNEDLQMPQATQSLFYAVTFMPWSLKPIYGLIADRIPIGGYHFRPWLAISSVGSAACYLFMANGVHTVGGAFAVGLLRAICNAFAELMLGAVLVSHACGANGRSPTSLQAGATSCRFAGTCFTSLVGLFLYPCGTKRRRLSDRTVISLTAFFPAAAALLSAILSDERTTTLPMRRSAIMGGRWPGDWLVMAALVVVPIQAAVLWAQACSPSSCSLVSVAVWERTLCCLIILALLLPSITALTIHSAQRKRSSHRLQQPLTDSTASLEVLAPCVEPGLSPSRVPPHDATVPEGVPACGGIAGRLSAAENAADCTDAAHTDAARTDAARTDAVCASTRTDARDDERTERGADWTLAPWKAVVVLLSLTMTPSAAIQLANFRYELFFRAGALCDTQYLSLIGNGAAVASTACFGYAFRGRPLWHAVIGGGLLGALGGLFDLPLPLLCAKPTPTTLPPPPTPPPMPMVPPVLPPPGAACETRTAFGVAAAAATVGSFTSELAFLPKQVIATSVAAALTDAGRLPGVGAAQYYAVMLMVIDLGDSISLQLTAPLVHALGISSADFSALPALVGVQVACSATALLGLALCVAPWKWFRRGGRARGRGRGAAADNSPD